MSEWTVSLKAEPIIPEWTHEAPCGVNGSELERIIMLGFSREGDPIWGTHKAFTFHKTFTFKEHGEFFRGARTMASLRYAGDFYELLRRYEKVEVTIVKEWKEDK